MGMTVPSGIVQSVVPPLPPEATMPYPDPDAEVTTWANPVLL